MQTISKSNMWKRINPILIVMIFASLTLLVMKVWYDSKLIVNPLLPNYTALYLNGGAINVMCFLIAGLIPTIYLRIKRQYLVSTMCIIVFFVVALCLKNSLHLYEHFYSLT